MDPLIDRLKEWPSSMVAAHIAGMRDSGGCSRISVWRWVSSGKFPAGKRWMVERALDELERLWEGKERPARFRQSRAVEVTSGEA